MAKKLNLKAVKAEAKREKEPFKKELAEKKSGKTDTADDKQRQNYAGKSSKPKSKK